MEKSFYEESYTLLRDAVLEHLGEFLTPDDVAEEALCIDAIRRAGTALVARTREVEEMREAVRRLGEGEWLIGTWIDERGDFCWRVNVRDEPSQTAATKRRTTITYSPTEHVGRTPVEAVRRALAAQEGTR